MVYGVAGAVPPPRPVPYQFNARRYECDPAPYPTVMKIFDECLKLDAFVAAQPMKQPDAA